MKRNQNRAGRKSSRHRAATQSKTQEGEGKVRPPSAPPCIALFPEGDDSTSEEIIDLSHAEYASLKRAAAPTGTGVLMFMANVALEKIGAPSAAAQSQTTGRTERPCSPVLEALSEMEFIINESIALIDLLTVDRRSRLEEGYRGPEHRIEDYSAAGVISLSADVKDHLLSGWEKAFDAAQNPKQRRAVA